MSDYQTDTLTWSEHQAQLLRRMARGEPPNESPDWDNIIEEVLDVGRSELRSVQSLLFQTMLHRLKMQAWPNAQAVSHWDAERRAALVQARRQYQPSMRQRLDLPQLYRDAVDALPVTMDGQAPDPVPRECPSLEELLERRDPSAT